MTLVSLLEFWWLVLTHTLRISKRLETVGFLHPFSNDGVNCFGVEKMLQNNNIVWCYVRIFRQERNRIFQLDCFSQFQISWCIHPYEIPLLWSLNQWLLCVCVYQLALFTETVLVLNQSSLNEAMKKIDRWQIRKMAKKNNGPVQK